MSVTRLVTWCRLQRQAAEAGRQAQDTLSEIDVCRERCEAHAGLSVISWHHGLSRVLVTGSIIDREQLAASFPPGGHTSPWG